MAARARPLPLAERLRGEGLWALLVAVVAFTLYAATLVPGPFDGDYGEFQYMPRILGLLHPTGYPLYLLLGWLWSWMPVGTLAFRMNLMSAFWAAVTVTLLFILLRRQGFSLAPAVAGAFGMALAPFFWLYAGLAAVYTLHTALLAGALLLWLEWSARLRSGEPASKLMGLAALVTGLALTNHPTALFIVPATLLFVLLHLVRLPGAGHAPRPSLRALGASALLFALPGLLYGYIPLRLAMLGLGEGRGGLVESVAKGVVTPFLQWGQASVLPYVMGRSLLGGYGVRWGLLLTDLPALLREQFGLPLFLLGLLGAAVWLRRRPRAFVLLAALFLPAALYAVTYAANFEERNEIAHLEGHLLPAMLVFALWAAQGMEAIARLLTRIVRRATIARGLGALLAIAALLPSVPRTNAEIPTANARVQSDSIHDYWTEVLAYPLEPEAALSGHWGDLTAFWYFQHGEGLRPDLWALFPPNPEQIESWVADSGHPLYLAGPLINWTPDLAQRYSLTPWGILVRVAQPGTPVTFPPLQARSALFGGQVQLEGYRGEEIAPGRKQLWMAWRTVAPTPRDLSVSVRLHGPDGASLFQEDGRLASLWYPEGTMPPDQPLLTVFDLELPENLPGGTVVRIVVYDPMTGQPLLTAEGQDVFELGPFE